MERSENKFLIVGLGNPGRKYESTRHNVGFMVLDALLKKYGGTLRKDVYLEGEVGSHLIFGHKIYFLKPLTFMNNSGSAVKKALDYYKIKSEFLLVLADDKDTPFGELRLKKEGSSGGHNGLKSIIESLGTADFPRLKIGIGSEGVSLTEHVLGVFTQEEQKFLPCLIEEAASVVELYLKEGIEKAMNTVNVRGRQVWNNKIDGEKDEKREKKPL